GDLKKLCQRAPLADAFRDLARGNPNALRTALGSSSAEAAEAAAYLTGLVGDPRLLDALGTALQSDEPAVRREALLALKQFGGGRALELVARAIHDPDPGVRLYALRHVVSHRYAPALARVAELLDREVQEDQRSMTERRLLFEAYGALGGSSVVEELSRRMRRRGGLFRKTDPEEIACVLVGLGATTAPAARAILESALDDKQPLVSRTARQVLDTWGAPVAWSA
ncbi:MAG: HEAT repeat domain-containing protein, partial [Gemmatimonadota bacterium]